MKRKNNVKKRKGNEKYESLLVSLKEKNERRKNANKGEIIINSNALCKAEKRENQMRNNANKGEKRESKRR